MFPNQFGFKKNSSTESALLFLTSIIANEIYKKHIICITFLDCSKAFDTISHEIVCTKLRKNSLI